jgi:hypothetical protein
MYTLTGYHFPSIFGRAPFFDFFQTLRDCGNDPASKPPYCSFIVGRRIL